MKTKIKRKSRKIFECFTCEDNFYHKPYRKYKEHNGKSLVFCKSNCWKYYSDRVENFYEDRFDYEVLSSYPVQQFIDYLKNYIDYKDFHIDFRKRQFDYKKVLKYIEDSIKNKIQEVKK